MNPDATGRTLVAGIGNIFLGDDGFGVEVAHRLAEHRMPAGVEVADFGIRGIHLAYELLDGADLLVLVDAACRGESPGTVSLLEVDRATPTTGGAVLDAHGLTPDAVLGLIDSLNCPVGRIVVVACEPANITDGIGLSDPVSAAVSEAVELIDRLFTRELAGRPETTKEDQRC